jgi:TPR repeat protein
VLHLFLHFLQKTLAKKLNATKEAANNVIDGVNTTVLNPFPMQCLLRGRRSCELKFPDGCNALGTLYRNGKGVAKDDKKANELANSSCEAGSAKGCSHVGDTFLNDKMGSG